MFMPAIDWQSMFCSGQIATDHPDRLSTMSEERRSSLRGSVPRATIKRGEPLPCPQCHEMNTAVAYKSFWTECHICEACHHVWNVERTPPGTTIH